MIIDHTAFIKNLKTYLSEQFIPDVLEVVHHDADEDIVEDERPDQNPQNHIEICQPVSTSLGHLFCDVQPIIQREDLKQSRHRGPHVAEPVPAARAFTLQLVSRAPEDDHAEDGEDVEEDAQQDRDEDHGGEGVDDGRHQEAHLLDPGHRLQRTEDAEDSDVVHHLGIEMKI